MTGSAEGKRVLIIEDEALIAMTAEDLLDDLGWAPVGVATSCERAIEAVAAGGFDVALLDINLRGEDSGPVADALLSAGKPFVFTTGYGSARVPERHAGRTVVTKPYGAEALASALDAALQV